MSQQSIPTKYLDRAYLNSDLRENGCRISRYAKNNRGYPLIGVADGTKFLAHRLSWIRAFGPIPAGMTVDHKDCPDQACVEPSHLQLLSRSQNKIKSSASSAWGPGTCKRGHPDSFRVPVTCRRKNGTPYETTVCSECVRERQRGRTSKVL